SISAGGIQQLTQFSSSAASPSYANATEVFDSLGYGTVAVGTVTLAPQIVTSATSYWSLATPGSSTTTESVYAPVAISTSMAGALPVLVVNIVSASKAQSVLSLSLSTNTPPSTYGTNEGDLQVVGGNSEYLPGEIQVAPAATSYLQITGFNPQTDEEIYAFDVLVN